MVTLCAICILACKRRAEPTKVERRRVYENRHDLWKLVKRCQKGVQKFIWLAKVDWLRIVRNTLLGQMCGPEGDTSKRWAKAGAKECKKKADDGREDEAIDKENEQWCLPWSNRNRRPLYRPAGQCVLSDEQTCTRCRFGCIFDAEIRDTLRAAANENLCYRPTCLQTRLGDDRPIEQLFEFTNEWWQKFGFQCHFRTLIFKNFRCFFLWFESCFCWWCWQVSLEILDLDQIKWTDLITMKIDDCGNKNDVCSDGDDDDVILWSIKVWQCKSGHDVGETKVKCESKKAK